MAERLARTICTWTGCRAVVEHYDLAYRVRERREKRERERRRLSQLVHELQAEIVGMRAAMSVAGGRYERHEWW